MTPELGQFFLAHHLLAVFTGAFFFGESVIITSMYLAARMNWSVAAISIAIFLATVISDALWFLLGHILKEFAGKLQFLQKQREKASELLAYLAGARPFRALLFIKFLYGSRIAMIFYLAAQKIPFLKFLFYNSIGTVIWLCVILPIGYLAGKGAERALRVFNTIQLAIIVLIISAVAYRLFSLWLTRKITEKK